MSVATRSFVATGLALMGTGMVTVAQIAPPLQKSETRIVEAAVSLVAAVGNSQACTGYNISGCDINATPVYTPVSFDPSQGSAANIPANLVNGVLSMPGSFLDAINDLSYALEVTGNWWVYTPTNVLGFDPADPPKIAALANLLIPFKPISNAVGESLAWWGRANLPMDPSCTGTVGPACSDIAPIFSKMFLAPIWTLASGYQFPKLYNPVSDAEGALGEVIPGSTGAEVPWSGSYVKLDTLDPIKATLKYLFADPSTNAPKPITLPEIGATLQRFVNALVLAFNPFVPKSYLLKGWPYTALTPLFLPFVPIFCKTCDPNNPGGPAITPAQSAAAEAPTVLASATTSKPADAGVDVSGLAAADNPVTAGNKRDSSAGDAPAGVTTPALHQVAPAVDTPAVDTAKDIAIDTSAAPDVKAPTGAPSVQFHAPRRGRSVASLDVLPGSANAKAGGTDNGSAPRARASAAADK